MAADSGPPPPAFLAYSGFQVAGLAPPPPSAGGFQVAGLSSPVFPPGGFQVAGLRPAPAGMLSLDYTSSTDVMRAAVLPASAPRVASPTVPRESDALNDALRQLARLKTRKSVRVEAQGRGDTGGEEDGEDGGGGGARSGGDSRRDREEAERARVKERAAASEWDGLSPEGREEKEADKDLAAQRCLRVFNAVLLLLGAALVGLSAWAATSLALAGSGTTLAYAMLGVGGLVCCVTLLGLLGTLRGGDGAGSSRLLLAYYACLVFLVFGLTVLAGCCFIFSRSAVEYVDQRWDAILAALPPAQRGAYAKEHVIASLRGVLLGAGAGASLMVLLLLSAMSSVVRLVTPLRAMLLLLTSTNTTLLPVGISLIAVATYAADTALGAESAFAAFSAFVLGMAVLCILFLGCCGTSLRSRGLLLAFTVVTGILLLAFGSFGAASFVASDRIQRVVVSNWPVLRRLIPSVYAARYDVDQFARFVADNISALGFLSLTTAVLLLAQTVGAWRLRRELRLALQIERDAQRALSAGFITAEEAAVLSTVGPLPCLEAAWKRAWSRGSRRSRCGVACCFVLVVLCLASVMGVATSVLYYTTSCTKLGSYAAEQAYPLSALPPLASPPSAAGGSDPSSPGVGYFITHSFTRGSIVLSVGSSATFRPSGGASSPAAPAPLAPRLSIRKSAYQASMTTLEWPAVVTRNSSRVGVEPLGDGRGLTPSLPFPEAGVVASEAAPTMVFNVDASCQAARIELSLPPNSALAAAGYNGTQAGSAGPAADAPAAPLAVRLDAGSLYAGVEADWRAVEPSERPFLRRLDVSSTSGAIDLLGVRVGAKGAKVSSQTGQVTLQDLTAVCSAADVGGEEGTGGLLLSSLRGGVLLDGATIVDCDVAIRGEAAMVQVWRLHARGSLGPPSLLMSAGKGSVAVDASSVGSLAITGDEGSVRITNTAVQASLRVAAGAGDVTLSGLRVAPRAGVQVDTDTGKVIVRATEFAGIVSVVTGGSITCLGDGFDGSRPCAAGSLTTEAGSDGTPLNVVEQVTVNCAGAGDCAYLGGLTVTSAYGDVLLVFDKWRR